MSPSPPTDISQDLGKARACAVVWRLRGEMPEFLLISTAGKADRYTLPGGKIASGTDPRETAQRETREEAGVLMDLQQTLGSYLHIKTCGIAHPTTVFLARFDEQHPSHENRTLVWLTADELRTCNMSIRDGVRQQVLAAADWLAQNPAAA